MNELNDKRADTAFLSVAGLIAEFRAAHPEYGNTEMAYAMLQICACIDDGSAWWAFLHEALDECIDQECAL